MTFDIEIRNKVTGRAVTLPGRQAVADFLAGLDKSEWEGYTCLGELPEPTQLVKAAEETDPIVDTSIEPFREIDATLAAGVIADLSHLVENSVGDSAVGEVEMSAANPLGLKSVADAQAVGDLTLSVGDSGAGDSYLPADAAGEQA